MALLPVHFRRGSDSNPVVNPASTLAMFPIHRFLTSLGFLEVSKSACMVKQSGNVLDL